MTPLDEKSQKKLIEAVQGGDLASFNKIILGKEAPGILDYVFPTGKFTETRETFRDLVKLNIAQRMKESQASENAPTLGQFAGAQGGLPSGFLEQNQVAQPSAMTPLSAPNYQEGAVTPPLSARYAQEIGAFNPQARLSPSQMTVAEPLLKQQAVLGQGGEIVPVSLSKHEKPEKPIYHFTTLLNPASGVEEEVRIDMQGNKLFLGPKGSPEAAKAKKQAHDLEYRREVENEAKTRIGRAFAFAGFKESPFDATGNLDVTRLLAPGAVDLDNLMYWAESAVNEPKLKDDVKIQLQHFLSQIKDAVKRKKPSEKQTPSTGTVLKFDSKGNPIK